MRLILFVALNLYFHLNIKNLRHIFLILLVFYVSVFFISCHGNSDANVSNKSSIDSLILKSERIKKAEGPAKALVFFQESFEKLKGINIDDSFIYCNYCNEIYSRDLKDFDKSLEIADRMLGIAKKAGSGSKGKDLLIKAYNLKADALMAKGLYNESYNYYFKAQSLAKSDADSCALSSYSFSLGMATFKQQKFEKAARHFKESYYEAGFCDDNFTYFCKRQQLLDNIGLCYGRLHQLDSAVLYYQMALDYIHSHISKYPNGDSITFQAAEAVVNGNLADVYVDLKQYDTAILLLNKSIEVNLQKGYENGDAAIDQIKLGKLYLATGKLGELGTLLQRLKAETDTIHDTYILKEWNRLMWQLVLKGSDSIAAAHYALAYVALNDSFLKSNKILMASDIEGSIRTLEKEQEIKLLEKDRRVQKIFLLICLVVVFMAILIVALVLKYSSKAGRNVQTLTALNNKINENKRQLELALAELEARDKDKSRILRSVAHDVMSPISAVAALTDILITESEGRSEDHTEILNLIREACNNSLNLSRDILDAAVTIAPGDLTKEWVDIHKLAAGCVELLSVRAAEKHQKLLLEGEDQECRAWVNREKIWRVINNLIMNAIKFSYENSTIKVNLERNGTSLVLSVKDNGIGIPEKNKKYIFDMFTESKMYGTRGEKPHGIGLSISLQVARVHGGDIWFESEEGKGTTFYFSFPERFDVNKT